VSDYANGLVKVVVFFSVIIRVPATTPAHNVFVTPQFRIQGHQNGGTLWEHCPSCPLKGWATRA